MILAYGDTEAAVYKLLKYLQVYAVMICKMTLQVTSFVL